MQKTKRNVSKNRMGEIGKPRWERGEVDLVDMRDFLVIVEEIGRRRGGTSVVVQMLLETSFEQFFEFGLHLRMEGVDLAEVLCELVQIVIRTDANASHSAIV